MKDPFLGRTPYNLLLVRMSDLTDLVHALPAYRALHKRYPRTRLHWLVDAPYAPLLEDLPGVVEPICFDRPTLTRELKTFERFWEALRVLWLFILRLRAYCFLGAIVWQPLARATFFGFASGARVVLAFSRLAQGAWILPAKHVRVPKHAHAIVQNIRLLEGTGVNLLPERQGVMLRAEERAEVDAMLRGWQLAARAPVVIHPGTTLQAKRWTVEGYAALADRLIEERGQALVISYSLGEEDLARKVQASMRNQAVLFDGTRLRLLAALFERAALVVAPDTGPLHLAAAQGAPVVGLYGPSDPALSGPYFEPNRVVRAKERCGFFCLRRARRAGEPCRCMRQLPLEPVFAAASELLAQSAPARAHE